MYGCVQYSVKLYNTALAPPEAAFYRQNLEVPDDFQAEAWALGALLLELLTGRILSDMKASKQPLVGVPNPLTWHTPVCQRMGHLPGPPTGHNMLCGRMLLICLAVLGCPRVRRLPPVSRLKHALLQLLPTPLHVDTLLCMLALRCKSPVDQVDAVEDVPEEWRSTVAGLLGQEPARRLTVPQAVMQLPPRLWLLWWQVRRGPPTPYAVL